MEYMDFCQKSDVSAFNMLSRFVIAFLPRSKHLLILTSWQIEGEKLEAVTNFLFLGSEITVVGDCSREIRRWLLLVKKAMTNLEVC